MKNDIYDCDNPIRCIPEDEGCMERAWAQHQYCLDIKEPVEYQAEEAFIETPKVHIPVNTGINLPTCTYIGMIFILTVIGVALVIKGLRS